MAPSSARPLIRRTPALDANSPFGAEIVTAPAGLVLVTTTMGRLEVIEAAVSLPAPTLEDKRVDWEPEADERMFAEDWSALAEEPDTPAALAADSLVTVATSWEA